MYLKSLVLKGFKSFADRASMSLEPGVTCIVGPNGSGKSNISDAILWVLGERSPKNLRGQTMEDVIFAGSSGRKAVNVAEVTLVLDNSDGELPVEYTEIQLTRRMYRTGGSDYLINGTPARLSDFLDILHDSGLGSGTHSIISQGNLDGILQSKPEDRRALIEEAAGVLKHKQRKEQSLRKLEVMDQHLDRVRDIHREVARQIAPLERKAKRALTYKELSETYATYRLELAVDDLRVLQRRWEEVETATAANEAACEDLKARIATAEAEVDLLSQQLEIQARNREAAIAMQARLVSAGSQIDGLLTLFGRIRSDAEQRADEELMQVALLQDELQRSRTQLEELRVARDEASNQANIAQAARDEAKAAQDLASQVLQGKQAALDELNSQRIRTDAQVASLRKRLSVAQTDFDSDEHHLAFMNSRIEESKVALGVLKEQAEAAQQVVAQAEAAFAEATAADEAGKVRIEELTQRLVQLEAQHDQLRNKVGGLEAESKALAEVERAATSAAGKARSWVLSGDSAFAGAVAELRAQLRVEPEYEIAVERLLGSQMAALFADDATVLGVGEALRQQNLSGDLALVLSAARTSPIPAPKAGEPLLAHVSAPEAYAGAVERLLAGVVVADSLAQALEIHNDSDTPVTVVTRDGDVVTARGVAVLAGEKDAMGALTRRRRMETCATELDQARQELSSCADRKALAASALEEAKIDALQLARTLAMRQGELGSARKQLEAANGKVSTGKTDLDALVEFCATLETKRREARPLIEQLTAELAQCEAGLESFTGKLTEVDEQIALARKAVMETGEAFSAASVALANAQSKAALAKSRYFDRLATGNSLTQRLDAGKLNSGRKTVTAQRIEPFQQLFAALAAAVDNRNLSQASDGEGEDGSLAGRAAAARTKARDLRGTYDRTMGDLSDNKVEGVQLKLKVQDAIKTITQECGTSLDVAVTLPPLQNRPQIEEEAGVLKRRIQNLGTVNPEAADEYLDVKKRFDFLDAQLNDLEQARASLKKINAVIDGRMRADFIDTFSTVNDNFRDIFATLFPGGSAELVLCDPDDLENTGVEVIAQPKGKRISKMMLMSGGEKSLVAMALLFAVYKTRSTPFYVLDEVEAALDDTNLRRLLAYLNELRHTTQLIMITHQRRTMESADVLFGVSMQNDGVTKVISQRLERALQYAED